MAYSFTRTQKINPALVEVALAQRDERVPMLDNADLSGADLRKTDLSGGNLREANLSEADLSGAYICGLSCTRLI